MKVSLCWILGLALAFVLIGVRNHAKNKPADDANALLQTVHGYTEAVEGYGNVAKDPTTSSVAAVLYAGEIAKTQNADTGIAYFNKVLPDVKDAAVRRSIRFQLVDLYKKTGHPDKALEQLEVLIKNGD